MEYSVDSSRQPATDPPIRAGRLRPLGEVLGAQHVKGLGPRAATPTELTVVDARGRQFQYHSDGSLRRVR